MTNPSEARECVVCGKVVSRYLFHGRLGVAVCLTCPCSDVCGEDITYHCMLLVDGDG